MMSTPIHEVERLVHEGRFLEARSLAETLLQESNDARLKQLLALSMAKSGAPKTAMDLLEPISQQHPDDPETSGILGSIYKELFKETKNSKYAVLSRDTYVRNYKLTGNYYTGINAASMYAISGSISKAKEIARELIAKLSMATTDVWEVATLGEACLLIKEKDRAIEMYLRCRQMMGSDWGKINSIYNQLWLLNHYIPVPSQVLAAFSPPAVAAFAGHMIDHPARKIGRFPPSIEGQIKLAITGAIESINARIGYSSLACGGDILFAEAMVETGGEVNLFLPFQQDDFVAASVAFAGEDWVQRFEKLTSRFPVKQVTTEKYLGNDDLFAFQSKVIFGSAVHRAAMLHASPHLITVYSEADVLSQVGGTYDTLKFWPREEKRININPQHYMRTNLSAAAAIPDVPKAESASAAEPTNRHLRYLVCVDPVMASTDLLKRLQYQVNKKILGLHIGEPARRENSMLFACKTMEEAVDFAWGMLKLPGLTGMLKISLHAGLVVSDEGNSTIAGPAADVAWAINAFSIPGKAYSTFQFASILSLQGNGYALEYAGIVSAAGEAVAIFQVNRHADAFDLV